MRGAPAMLAVLAALLVGCSATDPGQPVPTPGDEPKETTTVGEPTSTQSSSDVPGVANPLDASRFISDSCLSLTEAQANELGVAFPGQAQEKGVADSVCAWENDNQGRVSVSWFGSNGIEGVYAADKRGALDYFEPAEVDGYPAATFAQVDERDKGYCSVAVGTADNQNFNLRLRQSAGNVDEAKVCSIALEVAGKVLDTVRGS